MAEAPAVQDKNFRKIDLKNLDKASREQIEQLGHMLIKGFDADASKSVSQEDLTMQIKAALYTNYERATDQENILKAYAEAESKLPKDTPADKKQAATTELVGKNPPASLRKAVIEDIQINTQTSDSISKYDFNSFIDFMGEKGLLTPEKTEQYKKPAAESITRWKEEHKGREPKKDAKGNIVSEVIPQDPTGNLAALYDYASQNPELIDISKMQGYMEQNARKAIATIENKPAAEKTKQLEELARKLKEDLGVKVKDDGKETPDQPAINHNNSQNREHGQEEVRKPKLVTR